jgi:hypothetical protein
MGWGWTGNSPPISTLVGYGYTYQILGTGMSPFCLLCDLLQHLQSRNLVFSTHLAPTSRHVLHVIVALLHQDRNHITKPSIQFLWPKFTGHTQLSVDASHHIFATSPAPSTTKPWEQLSLPAVGIVDLTVAIPVNRQSSILTSMTPLQPLYPPTEYKDPITSCSFGLSATSQQYFYLRTNQPPTTGQQYFSLRTNQHQPSATSQTNRLSLLCSRPPRSATAAGRCFCTHLHCRCLCLTNPRRLPCSSRNPCATSRWVGAPCRASLMV